MKKTLGGDRLGSGSKNKVNLHGYDRSNFDLSKNWQSSMNVGTLIPFYCNVALPGDTWDINLKSLARTIPTSAPLFGSFKLQLDMFSVPFRLYNGMLHNNAINIGMNMAQVLIPQCTVYSALESIIEEKEEIDENGNTETNYYFDQKKQVSPSSLLAYLGLRGWGYGNSYDKDYQYTRGIHKFNAVPIYAYYDIFKNYYANKQEEQAYVITKNPLATSTNIVNLSKVVVNYSYGDGSQNLTENLYLSSLPTDNALTAAVNAIDSGNFQTDPNSDTIRLTKTATYYANSQSTFELMANRISGQIELYFDYDIYSNAEITPANICVNSNIIDTSSIAPGQDYVTFEQLEKQGKIRKVTISKVKELVGGNTTSFIKVEAYIVDNQDLLQVAITDTNIKSTITTRLVNQDIELIPFDLSNIDDLRINVLQMTNLNSCANIDVDHNYYYPYKAITTDLSQAQLPSGEYAYSINRFDLNGICVKTYQSDMFNNWINTDWIDGENGINQLTAIDTTSGSFTMDALILAKKVYNMLNRVAISGGSYRDWTSAVYDVDMITRTETPTYLGGYSSEISFEEVVSTSETDSGVLGQLGGKGITNGGHGGTIIAKFDEPCIIMGIVSITPRISYSQGNKWYMEELKTMDDLHKPALDAIGFQNLMEYQMIGATQAINLTGAEEQNVVGKIPAWLNYMTDVNDIYGDFADNDKAGYMVLDRDYTLKLEKKTAEEIAQEGEEGIYYGRNYKMYVEDATTYIDPTKWNYAFTDTSLNAQNFWVQIGMDIKARRKMSSKIIPNL